MNYPQDSFQTGERFPEGVPVPRRADIVPILSDYGISCAGAIRLIDTTRSPSDIRLNYIIGNKWVLRFCVAPDMTETRLDDLSRLVSRYLESGICCPRFLTDPLGKYLHSWNGMKCYLTEYIDMPLADREDIRNKPQLVCEIQASVARFAQENKNTDLSSTMGMYSLFDLSPFDIPGGIDEKQENFNTLIALLKDLKEDALAEKLLARHEEIRSKLKAIYRDLPRCVFQGDENFSNILIDADQHFAGLIDFNLAGTEVIVNQLANLAGFDYDEENKKPETASLRLNKALHSYREQMKAMLQLYHASIPERQALVWYSWIVMIAQWPVLCYFRYALGTDLKHEILSLLSLIAELPEEQLAVI
ncbi:MAG: phosphotransferase [Clostridia bacterium]|nr:phosphotransferase [Clostridia bacterium]